MCGLCASRGGRRIAEAAALLSDEVLPERPLWQWVLSLPFALRLLLAMDPEFLALVLRTVCRNISGLLLTQAGLTCATGHPGAVTPIQSIGSTMKLNIYFHTIVLEGVYLPVKAALPPMPVCSLCRRLLTSCRTSARNSNDCAATRSARRLPRKH